MNLIEKQTACGVIRGIEKETCLEFRSVRYARAGRYEYPKQEGAWQGVYDATVFKDCCFQHRAFEPDEKVNPFYHKEFRRGLSFTYSEDCFFLNIWTPKQAENCPVLIFIHGGSFTGGSTDESYINGTRLAEKGIITVAMNYRLGPYGFCSHPELCENGVCGNYGLFDQTTAIRWVIDNIASFGGNPEKITLMGQSAGAMSVDIHMSNPLLKGKIARAVLLSGAGLQRLVLKPLTAEKTKPFWETVMKNADCGSVDALRAVDAEKLYYAWREACRTTRFSMPYTFPIYDGKIMTKENFVLEKIADVPYLLGSTCTDMIPIALEGIMKKWAKYVKRNHTNECYIYNFNRFLPGDDMGAWHSADLLYLFSSLDTNWRPFEPIDYRISDQLSDAVAAFVISGNPNCESIPEWKPGSKRPMSFCEHTGSDCWHTKDNLKYTLNGKGKTI